MNTLAINIGIALLVILIILLVWYFWPLNLKKKREQLMFAFYPTACAGSIKTDKPEEIKSVAVKFHRFCGKDGKVLNTDDYIYFVAEGNSMQFCGIHDKDLLFVEKDFRIVQLKKFPYILVLKNAESKAGQSQYKIRRAWGISQFGDDRFEKDIKEIMNYPAFQEIKQLNGIDGNHAYRGDDQIIEDFLKERLPKYEKKYIKCDNPDIWNRTVVISTTFDTDNKYIHFSIHPIASIIGIVKDAFTVCNKDKTFKTN